jgi:kumamolisin
LADRIVAVLGLDNRPVAKAHFQKIDRDKVKAAAVAQTMTPLAVAQLYNFPPNLNGSGQTIAIIELDGGFLQSDLNTFFQGLGLPVPSVSAVLIDGQTNQINKHLPQHPELNADDEVALDIQIAGAVASGAKQLVYFSLNTDQSFLKALNAAIHANPPPVAVSISWGGPEVISGNPPHGYTDQAKTAFEQALQDAANLGIPVCAASGDDGSFDGTGQLMVDFPASAPHALACGGTNLIGSGGSISSETVWNAVVMDAQGNPVRQGTGGGVSQFFAKPTYQSSVTVPPRPVGTGAGRGVPDVCGDADPATGYKIRVKGVDAFVGGTSAVAPLWAGLIALFGQNLGGPVGFLHPKIYQSGSAFRDITSGNNDSTGGNGLYPAGSGWDACTGLGSPKGVALLNALGMVSPSPSPSPSPTPSPKPSPTPSPKPSPKPSPTPSPKPSPTPSPKPSPTPSPKPSPTPSPTPTPGGTGSTGTTHVAQAAWVPPPYPMYSPYAGYAPPPIPPAPPPPAAVPASVEAYAKQAMKRLAGSPALGVVAVVGLVVLGVVGVVGLSESNMGDPRE